MKHILFLLGMLLMFVACQPKDTNLDEFGFPIEKVENPPIETRTLGYVEPPSAVTLAFDSPRIINGKYIINVFAKSSVQGKRIFGINLRLFYDAADFTPTITLKNFADGYGLTSLGQPRVATGNALSKTLLNTDGFARYVNGVVQLNNVNAAPLPLDTALWLKLFEIEFTPLTPTTDVSCAPIVWEKMPNWRDGGMLGGSAGLVITNVKDPSGVIYTEPTAATGINFNWKFNDAVIKGKYPYGNIRCPQ